jgi:hypothetical protein
MDGTAASKRKKLMSRKKIDDRESGRTLLPGEDANFDAAQVQPNVSKEVCCVAIKNSDSGKVWVCGNEPTIEVTHPQYPGLQFSVCVLCRKDLYFD